MNIIVLMHPNGVAGTTVIDGDRHYWAENSEDIVKIDKTGNTTTFPGHNQNHPDGLRFQTATAIPGIPVRPMIALEIDQWCAARATPNLPGNTQPTKENRMPKNYNMHICRFHPGTGHDRSNDSSTCVLTFTWDGETPFKAHDILTAVFKGTDIPMRDGIPSECLISGSGKEKTNTDQWTFLIDWFHSPIPEFLNIWIQDINDDVQKDMERRQLSINLERINQRLKEIQNEQGSLEFQKDGIIKKIGYKNPPPFPPRPAQDPAITNIQRIGLMGASGS